MSSTLRHLKGGPTRLSINLIGLTIGLASFLVMYAYAWSQLSYDRFHEKGDQIYLIEQYEGLSNSAGKLAPDLTSKYTEIANYVRLYPQGETLTYGDREIRASGFVFADTSLFSVFTLPFVEGDPTKALATPNAVVITETTAKKYFSGSRVIGETIRYGDEHLMTVTGIIEDVPNTSQFSFDFVAPIQSSAFGVSPDNYYANRSYSYLMLAPGASPERLEAKIDGFISERVGEWGVKNMIMNLVPISEVYAHRSLSGWITSTGRAQTLYLLLAVAFVILAVAGVNYVNMSTANAVERTREIAIRKLIGARKSTIIAVEVLKSTGLTVVSAVAGICVLLFTRPFLPSSLAEMMPEDVLFKPSTLLAYVGIAVTVGIAAGIYPAYTTAQTSALKRVSGGKTRTTDGFLRRFLVVTQFVIAGALLVFTFISRDQLDFLQNKDLGFEQEAVVMVFLNDENVRDSFTAFKDVLLDKPFIESVSGTSHAPGLGSVSLFEIADGAAPALKEDRRIATFSVDPSVIEAFGFELIAGREFREGRAETSQGFIINASAANRMGWTPENAIGKPFGLKVGYDSETETSTSKRGQVIGVIADFNHASLRSDVMPIAMHTTASSGYRLAALRFNQVGDFSDGLSDVEQTWAAFGASEPFEYGFLSESIKSQYLAEQRTTSLFTFFTGLALFVTSLGLLGMTIFIAQRRRKEISIRKVMGASTLEMAMFLSKDILKLVGLSALIASPLAYLGIHRWLDNFAYQTSIGVLDFVLAYSLITVTALLTAGYYVYRTANADPAAVLRASDV